MRTQAVILKKIPIREYDELVICYTKDAGKQVYQAKSVLLPTSKQAGHLDILNLVDFSLVHKNSHPIITSAYCLDSFRHLKESLSAMAVAYFLLECFDKLIFENEPDAKLWGFLIGQLDSYNQGPIYRHRKSIGKSVDDRLAMSSNLGEVIGQARRQLLQILGYDPNFPIEQLANSELKSLQFAREVLR